MADAESLLHQLRRQRGALAEFGLYAFRCRDIDGLLSEASKTIAAVLGVHFVKILERLPQGGLLLRSGVNWKPGVVGHAILADDDRSPGGYALMIREPVISNDIATETRFKIPDLLVEHGVKSMVNVIIIGEQRPFGVLEVDATEHRCFGEDETVFLQNFANLLAAGIERLQALDKLKRHAAEKDILAREFGHRVKNVLSLVEALASQTFTDGRSAAEFRNAFLARLRALSDAESLVLEGLGETVGLDRLIEAVLSPYQARRAGRAANIIADIAPAQVAARHGRMLSLALHELATNASKHGALSVTEGRVHVSLSFVSRDRQTLRLDWREAGGPAVEPPARESFGTRLLRDVVSYELGGRAELSYDRSGLSYTLDFPAAPE